MYVLEGGAMRSSRYNVIEPYGDEFLVYNTANGAFAALDAAVHAELLAGEGPHAERLAEAGFLTSLLPAEELDAICERFDAVRADRSKLELSLVPTYICNYRCPYCYEKGHNSIPGKMDAAMMDTIMAFVEDRYAAEPFKLLSVQWYGGDPSLALDVVAELSNRLIAWCDERGITYQALMLTNANLIDAEAAALIARCRISPVLLTIDGPEHVHNARRVAANGSNSYEANIQAARLLREQGVEVSATMNVDKVSWPLYAEFRDKLLGEEGIELGVGKLCDYGHFFGEAPFAPPDFDLFTPEEFFDARLELFASEEHNAAEMRELLAPINRFCAGNLDNYFVIDLLGDVYNCDGWVGDSSHVRFNLHDDPLTWNLTDIVFDATRDAKCSICDLLPVCYGNCHWERVCNDMPCHPFKTTIGGYLRIYRECFDTPPAVTGGMALLARPMR